MATVEETKTVTRSSSATFDLMMDYNYSYDKNNKNKIIVPYKVYCIEDPKEVTEAKWYTGYELFSTQFWETASGDGVKSYTIYFSSHNNAQRNKGAL